MSDDEKLSGQALAVSIKPAPFYRNNPLVWFRQLEAQFSLRGIKSQETKFFHVLASLPEDVAMSIDENVTQYDEIKNAVVSNFHKTKQELMDEVMGTLDLAGLKPSLALIHLKRKLNECGLTADEDLLKHKILKAMPISTQMALASHQGLKLADFVAVADSLLLISPQTQTVAKISQPQAENFSAKSQGESSQQRFSTTYLLHPFSPNQRPKICRYHLYFGPAAKRCKPWCVWPARKPAIIEPSSRSSSPSVQGNERL